MVKHTTNHCQGNNQKVVKLCLEQLQTCQEEDAGACCPHKL